MKAENDKRIPFRKALAIFIFWIIFLTVGGYLLYQSVLKPYYVEAPTIIKVKKK